MELSLENTGPALSADDIGAFEAIHNIMFPPSYVRLLRKWNGGSTDDAFYLVGSGYSDINIMLGIRSDAYYFSLEWELGMMHDRIPTEMIPLGYDSCGNLLLMSTKPEEYEYLFFWDHEGELLSEDPDERLNVTLVASHWDELVGKLKSFDELDKI